MPKVHHVIEYASVRVENGIVTEEYEQLFHAEEIPPHVEVLTRIWTEDIKEKPLFEAKRQEVIEHLPPGILLVGQNLGFDIGMLKGEGIDLTEHPWIDTSMLASLVFPELESFSLGYLSEVLHLSHAPKHRAMGDVHATLELLGRVWERLLELPTDAAEQAKAIALKSTPGYRMLFGALPPATATKNPQWLHPLLHTEHGVLPPTKNISLPKTKTGEIGLMEEPLEPSHLHDLLRTAAADSSMTHWIAVKNLDATVRRLPDDLRSTAVRILYPPQLLLDVSVVDAFTAQDIFTADEATLAIKLLWYRPRIREDFPLHGGEEAVWNGRLACTEKSPAYNDQYTNLPSVLLLDHRQLLSLVSDSAHIAHVLPEQNAHIFIDDASMLEDTATKAFGWYVAVDDLRAAAEGNPVLTKLTDLLQIWIEKMRHGQDLHYIAESDLGMPETRGLHMQIADLLQTALPAQTLRNLQSLDHMLKLENLQDRLMWIEVRQNGSQHLQSVPERVSKFLEASLYKRCPTTLLIPSHSADILPEILPPSATIHAAEPTVIDRLPLNMDAGLAMDLLLADPPAGKTIVLLPSKSVIENLYVKHMVHLEERGITMICQGVSGGQGRMQAEFLAASAPAIWLITPWTFEGIDLPAGTADHLYIRTLPFDHPSHPVFSRRSQRYRDGFQEYCVPRLLHRIFRLLRTYARFRTPSGDVFVQDDRLHSKSYGKIVKAYLNHFAQEPASQKIPSAPTNVLLTKSAVPQSDIAADKIPKKKRASPKKPPTDQLSIF